MSYCHKYSSIPVYFLIALFVLFTSFCNISYAAEPGISPPFGLSWGDKINIINEKSLIHFRNATREDERFIYDKLTNIYADDLFFVADNIIYHGITCTCYLFFREDRFSTACFYSNHSSLSEFESAFKFFSSLYGDTKVNEG